MHQLLIHWHWELFNSVSKCSGATQEGIEVAKGWHCLGFIRTTTKWDDEEREPLSITPQYTETWISFSTWTISALVLGTNNIFSWAEFLIYVFPSYNLGIYIVLELELNMHCFRSPLWRQVVTHLDAWWMHEGRCAWSLEHLLEGFICECELLGTKVPILWCVRNSSHYSSNL